MANDQTKAARAVRSKDVPSIPEWDDICDMQNADAELTTLQQLIWNHTPIDKVEEAEFREMLQSSLDDVAAPLIAERDALAAKLAMSIELLQPFAALYEFSVACGIGWPWSDGEGVHLVVHAGAYRRAALFRREQAK